ncbi:MAG: serine protease [Planctomycetaceae bacterium]|nr:serine protease [Planctomycetaceae bacterium]
MMTYRIVWLAVLAFVWSGTAVAQDTIRDSVVKIHSQQRIPDFVRPWMKSNPRDISGSGAIIEGKRILTNAHVVLYASRVLVQPAQSTERIPATVEAIAPGMDLAILKLNDEAIFDQRPPLPLDDELPKIKNTVNTYGYPEGGDQLSVTEGIISRVEYVSYAESETGMRIQVDAPVNRGNSGGPAIANGKIVGLVFSMIPSANNIGYLIPADEIRMFLDDVADGTYRGKPKLFDDMQTVENKALRDRLGLDANTGGLMITRPVCPDESYPLKEWDVITHIGDQAIDNQGNISVGNELHLSFRYLIPKLVKDGQIDLTIWRSGQSMAVQVPVKYSRELLIPHLSGSYPSYFICGPLVFTPASQELVAGLRGQAQASALLGMRQNPLLSRWFDRVSFPDEQLVVLGPQSIPSPLLEGYDNQIFAVVTHVDDVEIKNLAHLVETVRKAAGKFITFKLGGAYETMVFDRQELLDATQEILEDESIRFQASDDLLKIWESGE